MAKRLKGPSVVNGRSGRQANGTERTPEPGTTGRFLVLVRSEAKSEGVRLLSEKVGLKLARSADFEEGAVAADVAGADGVVFDEIGVAVVKADPRQHELISAAGADSALPIVEPERIVYACETNGQPVTPVPPVLLEDFTVSLPEPRLEPLALPAAGPHAVLSIEYLEGYRDAIDGLLRRARGGGEQTARLPAAELAALTEMAATWGLQVTRVLQSRFSGRGIKLAILDTGFDLQHPDFVGRQVESQSFVPGEGSRI